MSESEDTASRPSAEKLASVTPIAASATPRLDELIDHWHHECFGGTELGNHTHLWNLVVNAKEELKKRLAAFKA